MVRTITSCLYSCPFIIGLQNKSDNSLSYPSPSLPPSLLPTSLHPFPSFLLLPLPPSLCPSLLELPIGVYEPLHQFIDFRENTSHTINLTCPLSDSFSSIIWYRNGIELVDTMEWNLIRSTNVAAELYGVYQCLVGSSELWHGHRRMFTVARVLPQGKKINVHFVSVVELEGSGYNVCVCIQRV